MHTLVTLETTFSLAMGSGPIAVAQKLAHTAMVNWSRPARPTSTPSRVVFKQSDLRRGRAGGGQSPRQIVSPQNAGKRLKGLCLPPDGLRIFVGTDDDRRTCRFAAAHEADIMKAKLAGNDFPQITAA